MKIGVGRYLTTISRTRNIVMWESTTWKMMHETPKSLERHNSLNIYSNWASKESMSIYVESRYY